MKSGGREIQVAYIALELFQGGNDLLDYLGIGGAFSEDICKNLCIQLLKAIRHIHNNGVVHRDLKPENVIIGDDFGLKLGDFGFAAPSGGKDHSGYLYTLLGS